MIYKCPGCTGALTYDPEIKKMHCKYCDKFYTVDEDSKVNEADELTEDSFNVFIYSCTACGAELMVNRNEASTFCSYCGQPTVVFNRVSKELKPDYCIPFSVTDEEAMSRIREKLKKGWFIPQEIKELKIDKLKGIYIPFWLHDIKIREKANFKAKRGSGKTEYTVHFFRDAEATYQKITCDGSKKLNDELSQRLEPFEMSGLRKFNPEYMSGFYADRYDIDEQGTRKVALKRAKEFLEEDMLESLENCHSKSVEQENIKYEFMKHSYALLPAWFLTFRYEGRLHTILVNGQTGKIVGNVPVHRNRLMKFAFLLGALLISIFSFIFTKFCHLVNYVGEDERGNIIGIIVAAVLVSICYGLDALKKWGKYQNERDFFTSVNTVSYVKERQDNKWK